MIQCLKRTEEDRKKNFDEYWKLDWEAKKVFIKFQTKKFQLLEREIKKKTPKVEENGLISTI